MKIWYDDQPDAIIARVNKLLKEHGLWFEDDGKEHDGYMEYVLKKEHEYAPGADLCRYGCCEVVE